MLPIIENAQIARMRPGAVNFQERVKNMLGSAPVMSATFLPSLSAP